MKPTLAAPGGPFSPKGEDGARIPITLPPLPSQPPGERARRKTLPSPPVMPSLGGVSALPGHPPHHQNSVGSRSPRLRPPQPRHRPPTSPTAPSILRKGTASTRRWDPLPLHETVPKDTSPRRAKECLNSAALVPRFPLLPWEWQRQQLPLGSILAPWCGTAKAPPAGRHGDGPLRWPGGCGVGQRECRRQHEGVTAAQRPASPSIPLLPSRTGFQLHLPPPSSGTLGAQKGRGQGCALRFWSTT